MSTVHGEGKLAVGILIFDDVEVLDFAGPFEVFSVAGRLKATGANRGGSASAIETLLIAESDRLVRALGNFPVQPHATLANHPPLDLVVIPGGWGAEAAANRDPIIAWIRAMRRQAQIVSSVCTGAFLLAKAGALDGRQATTHWLHLDALAREYPAVIVQRDVRWVDEGAVVTSAGITAGIDMSLHLIERLFGRELAETTAQRMQYIWREQPVEA